MRLDTQGGPSPQTKVLVSLTADLHLAFLPEYNERGQSIVVGFRPSGSVNFKLYYPGHHESLRSRCGRWLHL